MYSMYSSVLPTPFACVYGTHFLIFEAFRLSRQVQSTLPIANTQHLHLPLPFAIRRVREKAPHVSPNLHLMHLMHRSNLEYSVVPAKSSADNTITVASFPPFPAKPALFVCSELRPNPCSLRYTPTPTPTPNPYPAKKIERGILILGAAKRGRGTEATQATLQRAWTV